MLMFLWDFKVFCVDTVCQNEKITEKNDAEVFK